MRIVALDPGGTTGLCFYWQEEPGVVPPWREWERRQIAGVHHDVLFDTLDRIDPQVVIYERFQYQRRELDRGVSLVLDSVEYIGVIKLYKQLNPKLTLVEQTPAQAKNFWTDDKLKKLDLWIPGNPHAMDATRHMLYYITNNLHDNKYIQKLKP